MSNEEYWQDYFDHQKSDPVSHLAHVALANRLVTMFNPSKVLDIGCGTGRLVLVFRSMEIESYGVDLSEYALSHASEAIRPYLMKADLDKDRLPFDDDSFDMITACGILEYLNNYQNALGEASRVIKDDGVFFMMYYTTHGGKYRVNIRGERFWIKEFESFGFQFMHKLTHESFADYVSERFDALLAKPTLKARIARLIDRFPKLGNWIIVKYLYLTRGRACPVTLFFRKRPSAC